MIIATPEDVQAVLALFNRQSDGSVWQADPFVQLSGELHVRRASGHTDTDHLYNAVSRLSAEYSTLITILERTEWQKEQARDGRLDHTRWLFFATLDVEHYYVSLRSLFDHLAEVCRTAAVSPGQTPYGFDRLLSWCTEHRARAEKCLGVELTRLVADCGWFPGIRSTRDGIVHYGALTIAFPSFETISFNVYGGQRSSIVPSELMTNENIADFELFMAWSLGNLTLVLARLATLLLAKIPDTAGLAVTSHRSGFAILFRHLERLAERLRDRTIQSCD